MKTFKQTMYIHKASSYAGGGYLAFVSDMSKHGDVFLGTQEIEFTVPDTDPIQAEIEMLAAEADRIDTEAYAKSEHLRERMRNLMCIGHDKGAV